MIRERAYESESGYATVFAMAFITVATLISLASLGQIKTNMFATTALKPVEARLAAVDGGVDIGIQMLRSAPICGSSVEVVTDGQRAVYRRRNRRHQMPGRYPDFRPPHQLGLCS